jgi:hypothetical protein
MGTEHTAMPRIVAKPDNLNEFNSRFEQRPLTEPVFLNSVPKSGTHLIRNIMRMFVKVEQQYHQEFIQHAVLRQHQAAFSGAMPHLSWGHLLFSDDAAIVLRHVHHILLVRDPYDWVLARARFFLSDTFQGSLEHLKGGNVAVDEVLNMMIFGIHQKAPTLREIYTHNAVSWLGTKAHLVRFEELIRHITTLDTWEAEGFFQGLFDDCSMGELPDDWRERVRIGADRKQSGTARENLVGSMFEVPDQLPDVQKRLVDFAAPGLRSVLGYD